MTDKPLQLLIVDDDSFGRTSFKCLLGSIKPTAVIHEAACYDGAVLKLKNNKIDLAFIDYELSSAGKNGLDVIYYINQNELKTRAAILSGYDDRILVEKSRALNAWGYILKASFNGINISDAMDCILTKGLTYYRAELYYPAQGKKLSNGDMDLASYGITDIIDQEVLYYLCQGFSNSKIAEKVCRSEPTIRNNYVSRLLRIFDVINRAELIHKVHMLGIVIPKPPPKKNM